MELGLKGKTALVLGGSQGLGKAIAKQLIQEGCVVGLVARSLANLEKTQKEIGAHSIFAADLNEPSAGSKVVKLAKQKMGGSIDILVTNNGGPPKGAFTQLTHAQWVEGFYGLWMSAVDSISEALPTMKEKKWGRVILVTSLTAKEPTTALTVSSGYRAGLSGLCKSISTEVAPFNITVNAILPGYTMTDRLKELGIDLEKVAQDIPARRIGKPEELASLAVYLASEPAAYINGQSILCDGGATRGI
jgi:3-oxoacyl-[acyl-carrier protein] reductase